MLSCSEKPKPDIQQLHLAIKEKEVEKLKAYRSKALEQGYITSKEKKYLKSKVGQKEAAIKLKGDWTDHLKGEKWSLRVKLTENEFLGTPIFSIQHPRVRQYLDEYFLHYWCEWEGVLTTKYDFIELIENNNEKGIYAFEEHFSWPLLSRFGKEKGPILKFDEDALFHHYKWKNKYTDVPYFLPPVIEAASIDAYEFKDIQSDSVLSNLWEKGRALLFDYQWNLRPAGEIFDLDQAAKYYAIVSVTNSYHALTWHNQRFYFNPTTEKLEHILYDGSNEDARSWVWKPIYGYYGPQSKLEKHNIECFHPQLFQDKDFLQLYVEYLGKFAQKPYLQNLLKSNEENLEKYTRALQYDLEDSIKLDTQRLLKQAKSVLDFLPEYKTVVESPEFLKRAKSFHYPDNFKEYKDPYPSVLVKAYDRGDSLEVINFYHQTIEADGKQLVAYERNTFPEIYVLPKKEEKEFEFSTDGKSYKIKLIPFALPKFSNP